MAFNGTGLFTRIYNWVNDRNAAIPITASRMDQEMDGFATGLSQCVLKDGSQAVTAIVPFAHGINIDASAPASPAHGDLWISSDGLMMRFNAISICIMPIGLEVDWGNDTPPTGWLLCAGQNVSRTTYAKLFAVLGTTSGVGDGSTTFGIPDKRGRTSFGKDNMGGSTAGRLTAVESGITGTTLGAVGGDQRLSSHNHTQNAHAHSVSDPTHAHGVYDPTHAHSILDPSHAHGLRWGTSGLAGGGSLDRVSNGTTPPDVVTGFSVTGIGIYGAATGIGIYGAATGISLFNNTATNNASGAGASGNVPPAIVRNKIIFAGA